MFLPDDHWFTMFALPVIVFILGAAFVWFVWAFLLAKFINQVRRFMYGRNYDRRKGRGPRIDIDYLP